MMAGFDPNIYTSCQILVQEIRNSTELPLCSTILRIYWAARAGSARFGIRDGENPAARIFGKGSQGLWSDLEIFSDDSSLFFWM